MTAPATAPPARRGTVALRVRPRSATAILLASLAGIAAYAWPFLVDSDAALGHSRDAPWVFVLLLPLLLAVVLAELAEGGMDAKAVALLGVLAAVGAALRPLGAGTAGFEPVFLLLFAGGRVLGRGFGFVLGAVTMFASALLTGGVGPWLPFQMLGAAWLGFFAGCLPPARGRREVLLLAAYAFVAGLGYGALLNLSFWPFATYLDSGISYVPGDPASANLARYGAFYVATSLAWDLARGMVLAVLVLITGRPVLLALRRAARRAAFDAPVEFRP
jgi:energy-coupling factor transport system substrate-specific component